MWEGGKWTSKPGMCKEINKMASGDSGLKGPPIAKQWGEDTARRVFPVKYLTMRVRLPENPLGLGSGRPRLSGGREFAATSDRPGRRPMAYRGHPGSKNKTGMSFRFRGESVATPRSIKDSDSRPARVGGIGGWAREARVECGWVARGKKTCFLKQKFRRLAECGDRSNPQKSQRAEYADHQTRSGFKFRNKPILETGPCSALFRIPSLGFPRV